MYPSSAKFSTRPASPQFAKFSPPSDYPTSGGHHHSMSMRLPKSKINGNGHMGMGNCGMGMVPSATMGVGHNDLIFPDDMDSIEFCIPDNMVGGGCPGDSFTERRRRGHHSRRSNHKMEVEQQVKWTRKNIAATMERFEPSSRCDYGEIPAGGSLTPTQATSPQHFPSVIHSLPPPMQQPPPPPINHVYSYAYYEPGAAKCHTNIPHKDIPLPSVSPVAGPSKSPPRNSIRALLAKSFRSKTLTHSPAMTSEERHTYTTRYGTTENLYEEVNDQKIRKVLSDNRIATTSSPNVREELRRVQHNHFRVLDELNLSLEALIMPPTPPDISPTGEEKPPSSSHVSLENLSTTLNSIELKDHTCINPEFDEGDLDSGFSGSGSSSGASYNESLRYYKTGTTVMQTATLPHNLRSCRSSTASGTSTSKSSMNSEVDQGIGMMPPTSSSSPFNYARRCSDSQRSSKSTASSSGTKPKKSFWTIKP